ncbi:MAG: hypothetical protein WCK93_09155 [Nitrosomonadales bacterium]
MSIIFTVTMQQLPVLVREYAGQQMLSTCSIGLDSASIQFLQDSFSFIVGD